MCKKRDTLNRPTTKIILKVVDIVLRNWASRMRESLFMARGPTKPQNNKNNLKKFYSVILFGRHFWTVANKSICEDKVSPFYAIKG